MFGSGVKEMYYVLRAIVRESSGGFMAYCECDNLLIVTKHEKPFPSEVDMKFSFLCRFYLWISLLIQCIHLCCLENVNY